MTTIEDPPKALISTAVVESDEIVQALLERSEEQPLELMSALSELSGMLLDNESLEDTLQRVAVLAVQAMPGCSDAGVTLVRGRTPVTAAATSPVTVEVDRRQYAAGNGPCLDAIRHRRVNKVDLAAAEDRWPEFAAHAREVGICSYLAAPLIVRDEAIGALNLYSTERDGFDALDDALVGLFCAQASVALGNAQLYERAVTLSDQLQGAMASRAVIEQAKGVLMATRGLAAEAAFDELRVRSQQGNRKLRDVAQDVIDSL